MRKALLDESCANLDVDRSYAALLKAAKIIQHAKSFEKMTYEVEGLRERLASLALRVEQHEEVSLDLRDQLSRTQDACRVWKMRAIGAEQKLEELATAVMRILGGS